MNNYTKCVGADETGSVVQRKKFCWMKKFSCFGITFFMVISILFLAGCARTEKDARKYIKNASGIDIPANSEMIYQYYQSYFQDVDPQYTVFQFESDPIEWLNENAFSEEKNEEFEEYFNSSILGWAQTPFPEEYIPTFENCYFWLKTEWVYFVYSPDKKWLTTFITEF